jgi:hypothetical protein
LSIISAIDKLCAAVDTCLLSSIVHFDVISPALVVVPLPDEADGGVLIATDGETSNTPTVCGPDNNGTDNAAVLYRMSHNTSSTTPTPGSVGNDDDDNMGYPGKSDDA